MLTPITKAKKNNYISSTYLDSYFHTIYIPLLTQVSCGSYIYNQQTAFSYSKGERREGKTGLPLWMLGLGMERLRADMNRLLAFLFHQGVLDEQFLQLQQLQDESSPNFVSEVVNIYFDESEKLLRNLRVLLLERELSDYNKLGIHLNQFMGSSSSIGAKRVRHVCAAFRSASEQNNRFACLRALEMLEDEYCYLKNKLHELFHENFYNHKSWCKLLALVPT